MKLMLRTCLFSALVFLRLYSAQGQKASTGDSLYRYIQTAKEDTSLVKAYYDYALILEAINLDSAAKYYLLGGNLSKEIDYYEGRAYFARNYSAVLNMQGKFDESMDLNRSLLELATARGHQMDIAKTLNNIASVFNHRGQYDSAYQYYLQSVKIFEQLKEDRFLNIIYQNIAIILDNLKQYEKALDYHRMAIEISRQQNDLAGIVSVLLNAAGTLNSLHRYDSALVLSREALNLGEKIDNLYYQHVAFITIGNIHAQKKNYSESLQHFTNSLEVAQRLNFPSGISVAFTGLAMTSMKMGRLKEANQYALQSLSINKENNYFSEYSQQVKLIADIKSQLNQYDSAYHYLLIYMTLQDSLAGVTTKKHIADLELKYQTVLKDKSITQQQLDIRQHQNKIRSRNSWLFIAMGVLLIVSAISIATYISNRSKKKLLSQQILTLQKEKELEAIKAAMEAREQERQRIAREMHDDMGAGLTSILYQANSLKNSKDSGYLPQIEKITDTSATLISQMRDIVWAMNNENDTLDDLVAYIRHQSGSMLSQADIEYEINTPEEIPAIPIRGEQRRNIYLASKEALHNIIKHAHATQVRLNISVNGTLDIEIADNGKGINDSKNKWGNGLRNMEARMQQSGGSFNFSSANPGTLVKLSLPLPT